MATSSPQPSTPAAVPAEETQRTGVKGLFSGRRRKTTLIALALLLVAVAVAVASTAVFSTSSANPSNTFTSGVLTQTNNKDNTAILTAERMVPGDERTGEVKIENTGDVSGVFSLSSKAGTNEAGPNGGQLADVLRLKVDDVTGTRARTLYDGKYTTRLTNVAAGEIKGGSSRRYRFTVKFPDSGKPSGNTTGDNAYQGSRTTTEYTWTAVSK